MSGKKHFAFATLNAGGVTVKGKFIPINTIQHCNKTFIDASFMGQHVRFLYLSHRRVAMAQASLRICAVSPEPSLLAYTNYGCKGKFRVKIRPPASLDTSVWAFKEDLFSNTT